MPTRRAFLRRRVSAGDKSAAQARLRVSRERRRPRRAVAGPGATRVSDCAVGAPAMRRLRSNPTLAIALRQRLGPLGFDRHRRTGTDRGAAWHRWHDAVRPRGIATARWRATVWRSIAGLGLEARRSALIVAGGRSRPCSAAHSMTRLGVGGARARCSSTRRPGGRSAPQLAVRRRAAPGLHPARDGPGWSSAGSRLDSRAWAFDLTRHGVFSAHDTVGAAPVAAAAGRKRRAEPAAAAWRELPHAHARLTASNRLR